MKNENKFQAEVIEDIKRLLPGCLVLKNDSAYLQGIPDLTILYRKSWAVLEVKRSGNEPKQPNQDYYIQTLDEMSFAAFIYPENKEAILNELQYTLRTRRKARSTKPQ